MQYLYEDELLVNPTTTRTKYADNKYSEITAVYDSKYGGVISSTDASGNTTDYKYDECGRIQEIRYPEYNSDNSYKYVRENYTYSRYSRFNNTEYFNVVKNTYKSSTASGYGTIVSSVSEKYDDYGNLVYRKTDAGEEEYLYDNCNRVVGYKNYDDFGTDAMSGQCSYDNLNRVETVTDALGNINHVLYKLLKKEFYFTKSGSTAKENQVKQYYDMFGNIVKTENYSRGINSNPDTSLFTYDLAGNVLTATDGNGNITVFEYDNIGNNIKTILADGTIQENKFTKWGTSGKVSVKDGEKTTSVNNVYADDRGLSTSNYSTGIAIDTKPWYNSYDANGYPVKCIAPNGNERLFTYDECGNIASIQNGSQSEEIFYNFDGQISKHNKYINGRLEHSINYGYDNLERLTSKTIGSNITKYAYDNLGNLTSVTSPSGFARTYSYDRAERLVQLVFDGKTVSYDYNADGTVKKITYPNGITTEYVYDDAKRATSVTTKLGSSVKEQYSYTYDGNGNVLSVSGTKNISYTYDNLNRLKSYTENGVTTVYTYDKRNNLISETCGSNVKTYEYSGDNRLSKTIENDVETVYEYDLNGNLIRRGNDEFAYDEDNKLVYSNVNSVETTYKIGVDGLRSSKTTAGISTDYSIDEAGNVISEGSEEIIIGHRAVAKKIGSSYYYYLYNAHGDVTALTDSTGEIVNNYSYDPWGRIISQTENVPNDIKYAGEYQDSETGLIYLRNRYYDPAIGRFITEDPAKDGLNWYAYCSNNPVNLIDPLGLFDYNDRLGPSKKYSTDVKVMQNELAWLGYYSGDIDGYFGQKTLDAVNAYKNAMGLGNTGADWGIVGKQTWESMGLIFRTQADTSAGVEIVTIGLKQYFDISKPVTSAVEASKSEFAKHHLDINWFIKKVKNAGEWNVKRDAAVWAKTLGISENSYNTTMIFYGRHVVIDDIGNITYGYLGKAAGFPAVILKGGSMGYHILNHGLTDFDNEFFDEAFVQLGIDWYNGKDIQLRFGAP